MHSMQQSWSFVAMEYYALMLIAAAIGQANGPYGSTSLSSSQ